ncbi:hypothetical protein AUP42_08860 [Thalassospira lucentensis]|uniref:Uncharacterized protein n=1 Tax=Thalassospira lucentensis TaxID=168935 RepID=A0A154LB35_9PROT|nr:hypothetical protein AUP42_08860 [Thalassospira lucentensis]
MPERKGQRICAGLFVFLSMVEFSFLYQMVNLNFFCMSLWFRRADFHTTADPRLIQYQDRDSGHCHFVRKTESKELLTRRFDREPKLNRTKVPYQKLLHEKCPVRCVSKLLIFRQINLGVVVSIIVRGARTVTLRYDRRSCR